DAVRALLKLLTDVHDALSLARREALRLRDSLPDEPAAAEVRLPVWARWLGLGRHVDAALAPVRSAHADEIARFRQMADAVRAGSALSAQRRERALEQHGVERVACVGQPFDPETMEVAEVVRDPDRTAAEVVDELRPGYRWRGRLLRYAQVRVARP